MLRLMHEELLADLRVSPVKRTGAGNKPDSLPSLAMMTDVDVHREGELASTDFRRFLRGAQDWLRTLIPTTSQLLLPGDE